MKTVYYCLNGGGYFGRRSLRSILGLAPFLRFDQGVRVQIFAVADPLPEAREKIKRSLVDLNLVTGDVSFVSNLADILTEIRAHSTFRSTPIEDVTYLIHDCSPTPAHYSNIQRFSSFVRQSPLAHDRVKLLIEKPAITSSQFRTFSLDADLLDNCYCDFIELHSRTFLSAKDWMNSTSFKPKHAQAWRNSGTGFKRVIEQDRKGVAGGALEDKAAHDFALSFGLLGAPSWEPKVTAASIISLLPADVYPADRPYFLTIEDNVVQAIDRRYSEPALSDRVGASSRGSEKMAFDIADSRITAKVDWPLSDRVVKCSYHFSWDGVDKNLKHALEGLELPWLGKEGIVTAKGETYQVSEARIWILDDGPRRLILNFLAKHDIEPWIVAIDKDRRQKEEIRLRDDFGGDNSLARVLMSIITNDGAELNAAIPEISRLTYKVKLKATNRKWSCTDGSSSETVAMTESVESFLRRSKLRRAPALTGVVIDLDNTLIKTQDLPGEFIDSIVQRIMAERTDRESNLELLRSAVTKKSPWELREEFGLSREVFFDVVSIMREGAIEAGKVAKLYDDVPEFLENIARMGLRRVILTRGVKELQEAKIRNIPSLAQFFDIEDIYVDDVTSGGGGVGKKTILGVLAEKWQCSPRQVLVIGDDPEAELRAALDLKMHSIHIVREGDVPRGPHRTVTSLSEIDFGELMGAGFRWLPSEKEEEESREPLKRRRRGIWQ